MSPTFNSHVEVEDVTSVVTGCKIILFFATKMLKKVFFRDESPNFNDI